MRKKVIVLSALAAICILTAVLISSCSKAIPAASSAVAGSAVISEEKLQEYEKLQTSVDNGHQPWRLNPEESAMDFASNTLKITDLGKFYDKIEKSISSDHATVTFKKNGNSILVMELYQPVKKGTGGIWVVTGWTDSKTNSKHTAE